MVKINNMIKKADQ